MNFEQAYEQFEAFRHKMVSKWSHIPIGLDDLIQEGDIAFYRAYKTYNEDLNKQVSFLTYAYRIVDMYFIQMLREINCNKRKSDFNTVSCNVMISEEKGDRTFLDFLFCDESFEESICGFIDIEKAFEVLKDRDKKIMYLLIRGYSQVEISKILNLYQSNISTFKANAVKKLKKELAV